MVRAPAHAFAPKALSRSSGFALLKPASKPQLDSARILTMSGTLAVNLLALGLLMMPLSMPPPAALVDVEPAIKGRLIPPDPVVIVPVRPPTPPTQATRPTEHPAVASASTHSDTAASAVVVDNGSEPAVNNVTDDTGPITDSVIPVSTGPSPMQLEYRLAPAPTYPRGALQRRLTGTVLLQVLVGIDGRPLEVTVAQSSGHRELDEAARAQVLKRWSFHPATKNGLAVQAIGMVPVQFALKD